MLRLEHIATPFGLVPDLALKIDAGGIVGLVGPNGAGKSTLLRVCAGGRLDEGQVWLDGQNLADFSARERAQRIAVVPQSEGLAGQFTVEAAVRMGRYPYRGHDDQHHVQRALADTGLSTLAQRRVAQLSGGERQRVLIARAFAQDPQLLLLDEPTAHLDPAHAAHSLGVIQAANQARGLTVICALHDLNQAALYCDRVILMSAGKIVADGSPDVVLTADQIEAVYGARVLVIPHPEQGCPQVLPVRQ